MMDRLGHILMLASLCIAGSAFGQTGPLTPLAGLRAGSLPSGFASARTGRGAPAEWAVVADPDAAGGLVLAQTGADPTDYRYPLGILADPSVANVDVSVRFKPVSGRTDQAGGLAVRVLDADNYIVVRANALEDNVNLYRVTKGERREIKGASVKVASGQWHTLGLKADGQTFTVTFDGTVLFSAMDRSIAGAGRVALWTKADSVTGFSDLTIRTLP